MSDNKPICGILAGEPEIIGERCADGATCHHRCAAGCWRRTSCAPLSGSGLLPDWSPVGPSLSGIRDAAGDRFEVPIAWLSGPAQDEQVAQWQYQAPDGKWYNLITERQLDEARQIYKVRALYDRPAQTEHQPVAVPESWWQLIHDTLRYYRMGTLGDGYGGGYPLIDAMTADGQSVSGGIEECTYLADAIWNALRATSPAQTAPQPVSSALADVAADSLADGCRGIAGLDHRFTPGPFSGARYCSKCGVAEDPDAARAAMRTYLGLDSEGV